MTDLSDGSDGDQTVEILMVDGHLTVRKHLPDGTVTLQHKLGSFTGSNLAEAQGKFREALRCQSQEGLERR